LIPLRDAD